MKGHIYAIMKQPGQPPRQVAIPNRLEALQSLVEGYIEAVPVLDEGCILCNAKGRLMNLPFNCNICGVAFFGTILFAGYDGEDFADYPVDWPVFRRMHSGLFNKDFGCVGG